MMIRRAGPVRRVISAPELQKFRDTARQRKKMAHFSRCVTLFLRLSVLTPLPDAHNVARSIGEAIK
ncbi:MAG: hypothetical protein AAF999_06865 [Pseudomonadota bacterium]